jgi:hypothetical protein
MDISSLSQLSTKNLEESSTLEAKTSLSPSEIIHKNELKEAANEMALKMAAANTASAKALTKLKSGCID